MVNAIPPPKWRGRGKTTEFHWNSFDSRTIPGLILAPSLCSSLNWRSSPCRKAVSSGCRRYMAVILFGIHTFPTPYSISRIFRYWISTRACKTLTLTSKEVRDGDDDKVSESAPPVAKSRGRSARLGLLRAWEDIGRAKAGMGEVSIRAEGAGQDGDTETCAGASPWSAAHDEPGVTECRFMPRRRRFCRQSID